MSIAFFARVYTREEVNFKWGRIGSYRLTSHINVEAFDGNWFGLGLDCENSSFAFAQPR